MKRTHSFTANDGTVFATSEECRKHEGAAFIQIFVGLTGDSVKDALNRLDISLADAFERAGSIIAARRREGGELKRAKSVGQDATLPPKKKKTKEAA